MNKVQMREDYPKPKKENKVKKSFNWLRGVKFLALLALAVLAYAGVMSLIQADKYVANGIAIIVVALLLKESL